MPELLTQFSDVDVDFILPRVFETKSALKTDPNISTVYYNDDSHEQVEDLLSERMMDWKLSE
jgi:hypothetical protein